MTNPMPQFDLTQKFGDDTQKLIQQMSQAIRDREDDVVNVEEEQLKNLWSYVIVNMDVGELSDEDFEVLQKILIKQFSIYQGDEAELIRALQSERERSTVLRTKSQ